MKLAFVAPFACSPKATVSARMLPMAAALVARGHSVHVLVPPYDNVVDSERTWTQDGVIVENLRASGAGVAAQWSLAGRLAGRVTALGPDLIHVFKPVGPGALALTRSMFPGGQRWTAPVILDNDDWEGHGGWLDVNPQPALVRAVLAWQEGWTLGHAKAITCASETLMTRSGELAPGIPTALMPNGPHPSLRADVAAIEPTRQALRAGYGWRDKQVVIYLGTIPAGHDMDIALSAFAAAAESNPDLIWCVIASGAGLPSFRQAAERSGVGRRIEWHGFIPHLEAIRRLVAADIAVYPYRDTNINRAKCSGKVIDYMAAGKPMVVSDVGMNRVYLTDGEHALLTPPGDGAAFGAALQRLVADPAYANSLGANAQERLWKNFAWGKRIPELEQLYARTSAAN
ncbi:MAG TPA: glycosyltransferase family 4 protein [Thermoflexales bacterium]|nr:glycosyltransferase family 4 protein [Thermoflexales bacterium]